LLREPAGASAAIFALLLSRDENIRKAQLAALTQNASPEISARLEPAGANIAALRPEARLPAAELAIATLKSISAAEYSRFVATLDQLTKADQQIDLFEYALLRMVMRRLAPTFQKQKPPVVQYYVMDPLRPAVAKLLSCLAYWGAGDIPAAQKAFAVGMAKLGGSAPEMLPADRYGVQALDESLLQLRQAAPALKRTILAACVACVGADGVVTVAEAELLRAVGDGLDCPMPPFLPGEKVG
jgi:hypothetical protein